MNPSHPPDDLPPARRESSSVPLDELQYHFEGLRSLFLFALLGLIATLLTVDLCFIRRQMVFARAQLGEQRPRINKLLAEHKSRVEPLVKGFTSSLQNFAASNHDFQPILDKYKPFLWSATMAAPSAPTSQPPAQPAPAQPR